MEYTPEGRGKKKKPASPVLNGLVYVPYLYQSFKISNLQAVLAMFDPRGCVSITPEKGSNVGKTG
jgi:hypothetical protein